MMSFQPDYRHFADVMKNKRPVRLPLYEHIVSAAVMEKIMPPENYLAMVRAAQDLRQEERV
ncbi:MAG: hypothetical protein NTV49_13290 [Kiritimatiellaeota bacterium]|nr:hypothetical protein [Kiritimatiellota bacterium]